MAQIITGREIVTPAGVRVGPAHSRVLSVYVVHKGAPWLKHAISEGMGDSFVLTRVQIKFLWLTDLEALGPYFRVVTGVGKDVVTADVREWEDVVPLRWEDVKAEWMANHQVWEFDWTMRRLYAGQGRRLGVWVDCNLTDLFYMYTSFEIEEG